MHRTNLLPAALAALGGVAFAVLLLFGFAAVSPKLEATDPELLAYWSDASNQRDMALSMYFFLAAAPFFLLFLAGLRSRLEEAEGASPALTQLAFALGISFAACLLVVAVARGGLAHSVRFGDEPVPTADVARTFTTLPTLMVHLVAMPLSALTVAAASVVIIRTKVFAAWLGWAGLAVAAIILVFVALLVGALASPLLQLWVVACSFELWRTRNRTVDEHPGYAANNPRAGARA